MTTIRCWHGAIAQKSYGIEKRYLCPPPMVHVSAGPHVTMSILHEKLTSGHQSQNGSENLMEQDCTLDDLLRCSFRNLHVTGTGADSSKRFKLGLQVFLNKNSTLPTATMDSNPIPIISKPSKKTAKAGNASCFILNGMSVSLLNRINAQTVRTKYMAVDNNAVCAKIGSWSSFTIKMVKPPPAPPAKPVLYGSEIILINDLTGVTTDRLIIRKVENGKVIRNGTGPVSQMQKIVLQHPDRVHPEDGRPYYLSASSIGSPKIEGKIPLQAAMDRSPLLEYRTSSKKARVPKGQESVAVDDFVCWTIAGIAKFDYTYFGPIPASIDTDVDSRKVPKVLSHPRYNSQSNTLVMKVKNVF
ncbi:beta-trefoil DNA-binding domain-containing protein, partial [Dissophora ornata]